MKMEIEEETIQEEELEYTLKERTVDTKSSPRMTMTENEEECTIQEEEILYTPKKRIGGRGNGLPNPVYDIARV
jgi:hypothetical protein